MTKTTHVRLYLAPAGAGKTAYVLNLVRDAARGLGSVPRVVVPTRLQVRAWRRRLAAAGGAIGVRVLTFDELYGECLSAAGEVYTELSEPVQFRLIRSIVDAVPLIHYAPLKTRPGFVQVLERLMGELKAARIWPEVFDQAVEALGDEPRLRELAQIYAAYQERLQVHGWADRAGLGWLAAEALEQRAPDVARRWPLVAVDGFDDFTAVQLSFLQALAQRAGALLVTLTGVVGEPERPLVHRRFERTRRRLEETLRVQAEPLPVGSSRQAAVLTHLEAGLFRANAPQLNAGATVELIELPDRAAEVRAAMRWLKSRLLVDGMKPAEVALLARSIPPYRPFITQTATEFGLPIHLVDGLPLRTNPAVSALLELLRLMLPLDEDNPQPATPRRSVIEAWRSLYFDWSALPHEGAHEPIGITAADAEALDAAARWGRVIGGLAQWEEALTQLARRTDEPEDDDAQDDLAAGVLIGEAANALLTMFRRFIARLTPPAGMGSYRDFAGWLEDLIGPDPTLDSRRYPAPEEPTALGVVGRARDAPEAVAERDVVALRVLKDVLRGLVWAEEALDADQSVNFARFFEELVGAVEAATYRLPVRSDREDVLVADVVQARGVPLRAVAVLGLAEGEFPATLAEDPFLRDTDRRQLREEFGLSLEASTESAEAEFFYETITRPRERLLLTRPRLADNGALWQASPFWEEVRRLVSVAPSTLTSESVPLPEQVASWPELMESLSAHLGYGEVRAWVCRVAPERQAALDAAVRLFDLRSRPATIRSPGPHDGDLTGIGDVFARLYGPRHVWSASRLEAYRTCPFFFFVGNVLGLEPRGEPTEGLDARQLGSIYHRILEEVYQAPGVSDPTDLSQLLTALPGIAAQVLDEAPQALGFRETAWWVQTRAEIVENVKRSLEALAQAQAGFVPCSYEAAFGFKGRPQLVVRDGEDRLRLRGLIDRVDRAADGRVCIIDYKTAGPYAYTNKALNDGEKLQLPLYALGARDALDLGEPVEGFYWHVRHAEASPFTLSKFDPQEAMETALVHAWAAVRDVRRGHFVPQPPTRGCPSYCSAASVCWRYQPGFGG